MNVRWSHCVLKVRDVDAMSAFYCEAFGWRVADRGSIPPDLEAVFLSGSSSDHHQLALITTRGDDDATTLDHMAFRVDAVADVIDMQRRMDADERVAYAQPVTHGNAVSVYFSDPEGNGIEVFCDTPWHVQQPQMKSWDPKLDPDQVLDYVRAEFENEPEFMPIEEYKAAQAATFGES